MATLTPKQEEFCRQFLTDLNGTQAAIRAFYSPRTAQAQSARLLTNVMVQARIAELRQSQQERTQITADEVLRQLADISRFRIEDLMTYDGKTAKYKSMNEWSESAKIAVSSVKQKTTTRTDRDGIVTEYNEIEFKVDDRQKALDSLGKHLGLFTDFNTAIASLKRYGLHVKQDDNGKYYLDDAITDPSAN